MRIYQLSLSLACAVCLAACSAGKAPNTAVPNLPLGAQTTHHVGSDAAPSSGADTGNFAHPSTETEFADALIAPLSDLNLVRTAIPPVLLAAARQPYAPPKSLACHDLATAIAELDHVLGADLDTQESQHNPSLIQRGSGLASEAVVDAVRDTTSGIIPFRGWIRRLTGAAKHVKEVTAAISAGAVPTSKAWGRLSTALLRQLRRKKRLWRRHLLPAQLPAASHLALAPNLKSVPPCALAFYLFHF